MTIPQSRATILLALPLVLLACSDRELPTGAIVSTVTADRITIRNSLFHGNTAGGAGAQIATTGTLEIGHTTLEGGLAAIDDGSGFGTVTDPGSNEDRDPLFVREPDPGADDAWGGTDDDYGDLRLQATSPEIDTGLDAYLPNDGADLDADGDALEPLPVDLDSLPRVVDIAGAGADPSETVDRGAYERQGEP